MIPSAILMASLVSEADATAFFRRTEAAYRLPNGLWSEALDHGKPVSQPAFNWSVGVVLSAYASAAELDPTLRPGLVQFADAVHVYWNDAGPVAGYDVLPAPKPVDRYYDDNAWMVMALVETYEVTRETRFLDRAEASLRYVLSGEDDVLDGGIYWRESDKASKNTCSNAPAAAACLAVAKYRNAAALRAKATALYAWCRTKLRDPSDGLYWDSIDRAGRVETTKWSYNSALMLRTARELGLAEADELAKAAYRKWVEPETHLVRDEAQFAHLLYENLIPHRRALGWDPGKALAGIRANPDGWYPKRWDATTFGNERRELIHQVSYARATHVWARTQTSR
ncbi:MAG: glycoside hydrolase family 76 protein [Fimbriimonadaceae bacterium]|nr:glycoside hydrolase family 76 protein [Fimbriimonadaceae bacterium]